MNRRVELSLLSRQRGHANLFNSFFSKPKPKPAGTGDPANQQKLDANGKPIVNQDIDPATGKPKEGGGQRANDPNNMGDPNESKDPLAIFDGMWDAKSKAGDTSPTPSFALDPEALKKVTEQLAFSPQVTPELLEKFKEGDPETISNILNSVGRNAYSTLMQHLPALTEKFVTARLEHDRAGLGRSVRESLTANSLESIARKNPVVKQQLEKVVAALYDKYPDATPDWVSDQAKQYFIGIAQLLNGENADGDPNNPGGGSKDTKDVNWLELLSSEQTKR